jgi:hypothetical protein
LSASPPFAGATRPFRFYDNRQKYLAFVNTCNEKTAIARRVARELAPLQPVPPALRLFDAGMGDGTVLAKVMRSTHKAFPTVPLLAVAKEISLEDVRLGLEKLPDRLVEHPPTVFVVTNLNYTEAPRLMPREEQAAVALSWQELRLKGSSSHEYEEQIESLAPVLAAGWQTTPSPRTGNPVYTRPSVLVIFREDQAFLLDGVIPRRERALAGYDLVIVSQPWRARMPAEFKVHRVLAPLARSLAAGGRLLVVQSWGRDPGSEVIRQLWPDEDPFQVDRHKLCRALEAELGREWQEFECVVLADDAAIFRYEMHTLPSEICDRIGTSTLFAAWNAAIYVNQIEDERLDQVMARGGYLEATQAVLKRHGGLWFNDEAFVIARRRSKLAA